MTPFFIFLLILFAFGLISRWAERTVLTAPMVFTAAGLLAAVGFTEMTGERLRLQESVLILGELALALMLFADATRISVRRLRGSVQLPARLLVIGMPLTILTGTVVAALVFDARLHIWEAAILATLLAPTDAGLGQTVVKNRAVPARIRQTLNVESGLNDGLAVPFLMLFVALAVATETLQEQSWTLYTLQQVGFGVLIGFILSSAAGWLLNRAEERKLMAATFQQLALLALALICWRAADGVGGNGFIAAFVGGLVVKRKFVTAGEHMVAFTEEIGQLLDYGVFFLFGMLIAPILAGIDAVVMLYAVLSLTIVRMLPVALALAGSRLQPASILFMGWFGPRGLASVVLGLIFLEQEANLPGEPVIQLAVAVTVLLSVLAHGISATPGIRWYAQQVRRMEPAAPERLDAAETSTGS